MATTHNIIFDLGGVLLDLDMPRMMKKFMDLGANPSAFFVKSNDKNTSTVCDGMSASAIITEYQVGRMSTEHLIKAIQGNCKEGTTCEAVTDAWNSCLGNLPVERLQLIKALREKGYKTYMLSNTNDLHWKHIEQQYLSEEGFRTTDLFDALFLSHEMHLAKPMPEIYRQVLQVIGSNGDDCLFIDDSSANVDGAIKEGIPSLWLDIKNDDIITLLSKQNI